MWLRPQPTLRCSCKAHTCPNLPVDTHRERAHTDTPQTRNLSRGAQRHGIPHGIPEQTFLPLCPGLYPPTPSCPTLWQPQAPLSLEASTCPANTRTRVFSPSFDPALLTNQVLPPWPLHPSRPSLAQEHIQGPIDVSSVQCRSRRRPYNVGTRSPHETKVNRPGLHWGN